jgi:hypothetical protein
MKRMSILSIRQSRHAAREPNRNDRIGDRDQIKQLSLASMSDALLRLRDDIGKVLSGRVDQLRDQLSRLGEDVGDGRRTEQVG